LKSSVLIFSSFVLSAAILQLRAQNYVISTFAGGGAPLPAPAPALNVTLGSSTSFAADTTGNVYIASYSYSSVFKLDQNGELTRVAGNGRGGYAGDGGPATSAQLNLLPGIVLDPAGNLYIADYGRIRRVSPSGIIITVSGNGTPGFSGDGGPATDAQIAPVALAVDSVPCGTQQLPSPKGVYIWHHLDGGGDRRSGLLR
jgi:hypothetical protein